MKRVRHWPEMQCGGSLGLCLAVIRRPRRGEPGPQPARILIEPGVRPNRLTQYSLAAIPRVWLCLQQRACCRGPDCYIY